MKLTIKQMFNRLFKGMALACRICEHAENAQNDKLLNVRLKLAMPVSKRFQKVLRNKKYRKLRQ